MIRSSDRLYKFILENKYLGPYVEDYMSEKGIPLKAKKRAIFLIWLSIGSTVIFFVDKNILKLMLLTIASIVSLYIWTRPTSDKDSSEGQKNIEDNEII